MTATKMIRIHTGVVHAEASKAVGERVIAAKWKQTQNQVGKERAICVEEMELVAPEAGPFRALVEAALLQAAQDALKNWVNQQGESCFEMPAELLKRNALAESFLQRGDGWMSKQELELAFTASATWNRIVRNPAFQSNDAYKRAANHFKESILKLSGKAAKLQPELCDSIMAKLEDADLSTEFGGFVVKRIGQIKEQQVAEIDLSML